MTLPCWKDMVYAKVPILKIILATRGDQSVSLSVETRNGDRFWSNVDWDLPFILRVTSFI